MWFGILFTVVVIAGSVIYVSVAGKIFGQWGWMELAVSLLVLGVCGMAGLESFFRQPNPYTRTHALYNMADIPPHDSLQGEGFGWMIQAAPAVVTGVVLLLAIWLT